MSLLVVDSDRRVLRACEELFALSGLIVRTAVTAEDALDRLAQRSAVGIITELTLPGMDGLTFIRKARAKNPHLAVVILTATPSAQTAAQAVRLGVDDYLIKHADSASQFRRSVRQALRRSSRQSETERLMVELADLNEAFLRTMVELQKANLELEARLKPPSGEASGAFTVLIIDDDPLTVSILKDMLERRTNMEVTGASTAAQARSHLSTRRTDLVLTDKNLGEASGLDLVREINDRWPDTAVILMTGFASVESAVAAFDEGVVAYLQKPFEDLDAVVSRIEEVRARIQREREQHAYLHAFKTRNADFLARYRLIKNKLMTVKRESP